MKNSIDRLFEYIDFKGISKNKFYLNCGLPDGAFKSIKSVGSENLGKIFLIYPELNFDWVITGRGKMLVETVVKCGECDALEKELNKEKSDHLETFKELNNLKKQLHNKQLQKLVK